MGAHLVLPKTRPEFDPPCGPRLCQNPKPGLVLFLGPCPPKIPGGVLGHGTDPNVDDGFQKETTRWEK